MNNKKTSGGFFCVGVWRNQQIADFSFSDRDETVSSENARPTGLRALEGEPDGRDCHGVRQRNAHALQSLESVRCMHACVRTAAKVGAGESVRATGVSG